MTLRKDYLKRFASRFAFSNEIKCHNRTLKLIEDGDHDPQLTTVLKISKSLYRDELGDNIEFLESKFLTKKKT